MDAFILFVLPPLLGFGIYWLMKHDFVQFMIGYINNNYINAYTDAINYYKLFIEKYPDDELIPSVEFELDGLDEIQIQIDSLINISQK